MSVGSSFDDRGDSYVDGQFDDVLLRWYHPSSNGHGTPTFVNARMFSKWFGKRFRSRGQWSTACHVAFFAPLRNIKVGFPAIRNRHGIGQVICYRGCICIHNLEGRRIGVRMAVVRVVGGHHVGNICKYYGIAPQLFSQVRVV